MFPWKKAKDKEDKSKRRGGGGDDKKSSGKLSGSEVRRRNLVISGPIPTRGCGLASPLAEEEDFSDHSGGGGTLPGDVSPVQDGGSNSTGGGRKPPPVPPKKPAVARTLSVPKSKPPDRPAPRSTSLTAQPLVDALKTAVRNGHPSEVEYGELQQRFAAMRRASAGQGQVARTWPLPPIRTAARCPQPRVLSVTRQPSGDFGFSLRRSALSDGLAAGEERRRTLMFAEPSTLAGSGGHSTGLLPGDRLLEVNGVSVDERSREEVIEMVRSSGDRVLLKVQPLPELCEIVARVAGAVPGATTTTTLGGRTLSRTGSRRHKALGAKTDEEIAAERLWMKSEKVWVLFRGGYTGASLVPKNESGGTSSPSPAEEEGKLRVRLDATGEVVLVDEDDVEKANPPELDFVEDLGQLRQLNEAGVVHVLRERFASGLVHTYAGSGLLLFNPQRPLAIYSDKVMRLFQSCKPDDLPPHVFAVAQSAHSALVATRRDQTVLFLGRSGAGQSSAARQVLQYLSITAAPTAAAGNALAEKLTAAAALLESFGNCRTAANANASRFTQLFSLDFDYTGQVVSASVQALMLERSRVSRRPEGEPNFHIFYYLLAGAGDSLRKELHLDNLEQPNLFVSALRKPDDQKKARLMWELVQGSLQTLSVRDAESRVLWMVLAAIVHLGHAGALRNANGRVQFARAASAQRASLLLGTSVEDLSKAALDSPLLTAAGNSRGPNRGQGDATGDPTDPLQDFVASLYQEVFNVVVSLVNRALCGSGRSVAAVQVLDCPGFQPQSGTSAGGSAAATLEELCHNYVQERLQLLFHQWTFLSQQERYDQEAVVLETEEFGEVPSPVPLVSLLDRSSTQSGGLRASSSDLRHQQGGQPCGLLQLLDDECLYPGNTDQAFFDKLLHLAATTAQSREHQSLLERGARPGEFTIFHHMGSLPVTYCCNGWLRASRETPAFRQAPLLLQESQKEPVSQLFSSARGGMPPTMNSLTADANNTSSLRRSSSIRRAQSMAGAKRRSLPLQVKHTTDSLLEVVRRTRLHFVHCLVPSEKPSSAGEANDGSEPRFDVDLVRSQLKGAQILDAVRIRKQGFPENLLYLEFRRRYGLLASPDCRIVNGEESGDERAGTEALLQQLDLEPSSYRLGLSQIFLRAGTISLLESQREEKLAEGLIHLQAHLRGYLARKRFQRRKSIYPNGLMDRFRHLSQSSSEFFLPVCFFSILVEMAEVQELAICCIQRNVRKFLEIRDWPWWRLFVKIAPVLNVQRTEQELRFSREEVEQLKAKVEKLEKERAELKQSHDMLEVKSEEGGTTQSQNSGSSEGEKRADDTGGSDPKDVEKERHYNSFMEARLKLGQTRTVAEPLLRLKARQQEPPPPQIMRRGSTPIFSQAMLRRPSERRLSGVKAKVASGGSPSEIDGVTSADDVSGETAATPGATRKTSSPTKSPRSSPSKTTSMSIASTTVVTTLGDLSRRDSATPAAKPSAPVTTLRITRKPSLNSASTSSAAKKTETSDSSAQSDSATKQLPSPAANDVKKPVVAENKASELRKASSPPKKATSTVPVRRKSQPLRIRTSVTVEESGTADPKPTATEAEQQLPPKAVATTGAAPLSGSVFKVGEKSGNAEKPCNATSSLPSGNEAKASSLDANGAGVPVSKTKTSSPDTNSALPHVNHVDASLPDRKDTTDTVHTTVTMKLKESHDGISKRNGLQQNSTSEQSDGAVKNTDVSREKTATFPKDQNESKTEKQDIVPASNKSPEQRESTVAVEEKKREEKMQTVDIRDLRILLRTPSPLPPKSSSPTSRGSSSTTPTITRLDGGSRKGSFSSLASRNGSCDGPEDVSEASTSGVSSLSGAGFRRDSLASSRPSSLSWDSDAALSSTATSTPSDAVGGLSLRSRSVSVESAADTEEACPRGWSSHVHSRLSAGSHGARRARQQQPPPLRHNTTTWATSPGKPWWSTTRMSPRSQVNDLWADLGQEQAASALAAEMLEAETAERLRLDKEVRELQARCSQLQQQKDRMEMEAMETRMLRSADLNGDVSDEDDASAAGSIYKQKYERALREAEMAKRQLNQQHEDDLEKQMMARKSTEKRLSEALADLDEGRQAVNQWKRKAQKLSAELQDLKLLVEEHMARNAELEKKQRKFDSELGQASEGLKQERQQREKLQRDKDLLCAEKQALEQQLMCCRAELDAQHDRVNCLRRELDELSFSTHAEEEVAKLKRAKQELERKSRDQEEELEDLAAQVAMLEQSKLRLEMALEKARQEHRRELSQRDEEADEARAAAAKKLRNMEALLESEQEERQGLQRQRQELERRLAELSERPPPRDPQVERRLRRDLRRTRALLQDSQVMLDSARNGQAARSMLRQLKNQLEDAEFAKSAAIKARQGAEAELEEVQAQLEEVLRTKNEAETRCLQLAREKGALQVQLEEMEEEQAELMKKYKSAVQQMQNDQKLMSEQTQQILDLESEKHHLKEQVHDLSSKMDHLASQAEDSHAVRRLEARVRELESRLELEQTAKTRLENQVQRLKEQCGRLQEESEQAVHKEQQSAESCRKLQRQMRELREDCTALQHREAEAQQRCHELEMSLENAEMDLQGTKQDLKLACQRIQDLQAALEEDLDSGTDVAEDSDSDSDNDVDIDTLLRRHGLGTNTSQSRVSSVGDMSPLPLTASSRRSSAAVSLSRSNESPISGISSVSPELELADSANGRASSFKDDQLVDV